MQTLCTALQRMIDAESFVAVAEAAVLKGLPTLERACASFGCADEHVQTMLKKGDLPAVVHKLLGGPELASVEQQHPKKRLRFLSS